MTTTLICDLDAEVRKFTKRPDRPKTTLIIQPSRALATLAGQINAEHLAVEAAMNKSLDHAMRCGDLLIEAKSTLAHGTWSSWLRDNFQGSDRSARVYMRLAKHRRVIEANRQSSADLTIEKALNYIAPRTEKPHAVDPDEAENRKRRHEEHLVEAVLEFDDMMSAAEAFGEPPAIAFEKRFPESQNPVDSVSFERYKSDVESWRTADWFSEAEKRVRQRRDNSPQQSEADNLPELISTIDKNRADANKHFLAWVKESRETLAAKNISDDDCQRIRIEAAWWDKRFLVGCYWRNDVAALAKRGNVAYESMEAADDD